MLPSIRKVYFSRPTCAVTCVASKSVKFALDGRQGTRAVNYPQHALGLAKNVLTPRLPVSPRQPLGCRAANSPTPESWEDRLKIWLPIAVSGVALASAVYNTSSSFKGLSDQIDKNQTVILEKFNNVDTKFANVDTKFANVDTKFDAVAKQIGALEKRLSRLEDKLYVVKLPERSESLTR